MEDTFGEVRGEGHLDLLKWFHCFDKGYLEKLRRYLFWKIILLPGTKWESY